MPDECDKPGREPEADSGSDTEHERPTVSPPFDPIAFARDVSKPSPPGVRAVTPDAHTRVTPALGTVQPEVDAAADRHPESIPPFRRKTPTTTLSLANARIPSQLPPRPPSQPAESPMEDDFSDVEIPTRPPPAEGLPVETLALAHGGPELERGAVTVRNPAAELAHTGHPRPLAEEMRDRISLGDYSGALEVAERILAGSPDDPEAQACAESCRRVLRQMYATRIGPLDRVPVVMVPRDQLRWLSIDHKAGFVLSLVDGVSNLEMIIDVSGMPELETLRILSELAQQRIISLR